MALFLFDFDGVLADTLGDMIRFAQQACDELGVNHVVIPDDLNSLDIMSFAEYGRQLEVPEHLNDEFVSRCLKKFVEKPHPPKIFEGMAEVIGQLSRHHVIAIVTGNTTRAVENFLVENSIRQFVSAVFAVDQPGSKGEKILKAKRQLSKIHEDVYYVGDAVSDIQAAKLVSVKSVAVSWGHQSLSKLVKAKPDYIVHTPVEIIEVIEDGNPGVGSLA